MLVSRALPRLVSIGELHAAARPLYPPRSSQEVHPCSSSRAAQVQFAAHRARSCQGRLQAGDFTCTHPLICQPSVGPTPAATVSAVMVPVCTHGRACWRPMHLWVATQSKALVRCRRPSTPLAASPDP